MHQTGAGREQEQQEAAHAAHCTVTMLRMAEEKIVAGLRGSVSITVGEEHTAPSIGSGKVRVLATPVMINLIEAAALDAVEHLLPAGYQSLGTHLDVRHIAATPVGMRVTATAEVVRVEGRTVDFRVEARDERELIGDGTHQRVVVNVSKFDQRVQRKLQNSGSGS
jgi:predicted thioesterase